MGLFINRDSTMREQELMDRHLPKNEAREAMDTGQMVKKLESLLQDVDETAGALMSLRDSLRDQTVGLRAAGDRAMKVVSIFEHQITLFTELNKEVLNLYHKEITAIAAEGVRNVSRNLGEEMRNEVRISIRKEMGDIQMASTNFKNLVESTMRELRYSKIYMVALSVIGAFAGMGLMDLAIKVFPIIMKG